MYNSKFKRHVALEVLHKKLTVAKIAEKYQVYLNQILQRKKFTKAFPRFFRTAKEQVIYQKQSDEENWALKIKNNFLRNVS